MERLIRNIKNKIIRMISRCVLEQIVNSGEMQKLKLKVYGNETLNTIDRLQEYGLETYPYADGQTEGIVLFLGGNRDQGVCVKLNSREYRPTDLSEGDVCLYTKDSNGNNANRIWIKPTDNTIEITQANNAKITLDKNGIIVDDGVNSGNKITMNSSGVLYEDKNGNSITKDNTGIVVEDKNSNTITMNATSIILDNGTNTIEMDATSVKINSTALEILP